MPLTTHEDKLEPILFAGITPESNDFSFGIVLSPDGDLATALIDTTVFQFP